MTASRRLHIVLYEGAGADELDAVSRRSIAAALLDAGYCLSSARCACEIAPDPHGATLLLGRFDGDAFPERQNLPEGGCILARSLDGLDAAGVLATVEGVRVAGELPRPGRWAPWFPVIDYDRCTGCRQCMNFCLFGTFAVEEDRLVVANPENCKTNCPACARVCPTGAIMFPKHPAAPINGGEEGADGETSRVDLDEALKGDVYRVLKSRGGGKLARAMQERSQCACTRNLPPELRRALEGDGRPKS